MIITRWQASLPPTKENLVMVYRLEGLSPQEESLASGEAIPEHRHPFDEIRTIISGELFVNISGNKMLLRTGDRIVIPANTRHSYHVQDDKEACTSLCANRIY